jgi:hypothetical protein
VGQENPTVVPEASWSVASRLRKCGSSSSNVTLIIGPLQKLSVAILPILRILRVPSIVRRQRELARLLLDSSPSADRHVHRNACRMGNEGASHPLLQLKIICTQYRIT